MGNVSKEKIASLEGEVKGLTDANIALEDKVKAKDAEIANLNEQLKAKSESSEKSTVQSDATIKELTDKVEALEAKVQKSDEDFKSAVSEAVIEKMAALGHEPVPSSPKASVQKSDGNEQTPQAENSGELAAQMAAEMLG